MQGDYLVTSLIEMGTKTSNENSALSFFWFVEFEVFRTWTYSTLWQLTAARDSLVPQKQGPGPVLSGWSELIFTRFTHAQ